MCITYSSHLIIIICSFFSLAHDFLCTRISHIWLHMCLSFDSFFTKPPLQFFHLPPPPTPLRSLVLPCLFVRCLEWASSSCSLFVLLIDVSTYLVYFAHFRICWKFSNSFFSFSFFLRKTCFSFRWFCILWFFLWAACAFACPSVSLFFLSPSLPLCPSLSLAVCDRLALLLIFINKPLCVQQ